MENRCLPSSFFGDLRSRELNGFRGTPSSLAFSRFLPFRNLESSHSFWSRPCRGSPCPLVVRKRPYLGDLSSEPGGFGTGVLSVEHSGATTPPTAVSFCKVPTSFPILCLLWPPILFTTLNPPSSMKNGLYSFKKFSSDEDRRVGILTFLRCRMRMGMSASSTHVAAFLPMPHAGRVRVCVIPFS